MATTEIVVYQPREIIVHKDFPIHYKKENRDLLHEKTYKCLEKIFKHVMCFFEDEEDISFNFDLNSNDKEQILMDEITDLMVMFMHCNLEIIVPRNIYCPLYLRAQDEEYLYLFVSKAKEFCDTNGYEFLPEYDFS